MDAEKLVKIWSKAQVLSIGPVWEGEPAATAIMEQILTSWPESKDYIVSLLNHPNALVVAHSLFCLYKAGDPALLSLDAALLESTRSITIQEGSFRTSSNLGSLARRWVKRASASSNPDSQN